MSVCVDRVTGVAILALVTELTAAGSTVVVITHDHQAAAAHHSVELRDGRSEGSR